MFHRFSAAPAKADSQNQGSRSARPETRLATQTLGLASNTQSVPWLREKRPLEHVTAAAYIASSAMSRSCVHSASALRQSASCPMPHHACLGPTMTVRDLNRRPYSLQGRHHPSLLMLHVATIGPAQAAPSPTPAQLSLLLA